MRFFKIVTLLFLLMAPMATMSAQGQNNETPTPTARPPIIEMIGEELVDQFRLENVWPCGGTVNICLHAESDAMVLTRVAMGETSNFQDRVYVMWGIKLRAALGFKEHDWRAPSDRWGAETEIKVEALCNGGCQYSPVRVTEGIYFPCILKEGNPLRGMLCPTDEQLVDFYLTYLAAIDIVYNHITEMPEELRGYDSFRSPSVTWIGRIHREGGLASRQFFPRANVWQDEYPQDNEFWAGLAQTPTPTEKPTATPWPTPTLTPTSTSTALPTPTPTVAPSELVLVVSASTTKESKMELAPDQILIVTGIATLSFWAVTVLWMQLLKQPKPSKDVLQGGVFAISTALAYFWTPFQLPPIGDGIYEFVTALMATAVLVFKLSQLVYDIVWQRFVGFVASRVPALSFLGTKR